MVITAAFTRLYIVIRCRTGNGFAALCAGAACFAAVYRPLVDGVSLCGNFNAYAYSAGLAGYRLGACFGAGGFFNNDAIGEIVFAGSSRIVTYIAVAAFGTSICCVTALCAGGFGNNCGIAVGSKLAVFFSAYIANCFLCAGSGAAGMTGSGNCIIGISVAAVVLADIQIIGIMIAVAFDMSHNIIVSDCGNDIKAFEFLAADGAFNAGGNAVFFALCGNFGNSYLAVSVSGDSLIYDIAAACAYALLCAFVNAGGFYRYCPVAVAVSERKCNLGFGVSAAGLCAVSFFNAV